MKANELRIGNYLQDNVTKTTVKVVELSKDCISTYVIDRSKYPLKDGWKLEPIPLTEEWLLRFGFEKRSIIKQNDSYYLNGKVVWATENGFRYFQNRDIIKYVHQLQNIYFALTGEELKLKDDEND
jgi:hypothetical protein